MLTSRELRLLETLRLNPNRSYRGATKGERISKRKGISIEFADFRNYTDGDDLRHLDWNVLARLETPVLRTYQDEEDLIVYLVVDNSESMQFGEPVKGVVANKLAIALAHVALCGGDGVRILNGTLAAPPQPAVRGRASSRKVGAKVESLEAGDRTLTVALKSLLSGSVRAGIVLIVSDGLDPDLAQAIRSLGGRGFEVWFAQVLDDGELEPDLEGDLRLIDSENGQIAEITVNRDTLAVYQANLTQHISDLQAACKRTGGKHEVVRTSESLEHVISRRLKPARWFS